VIPGAAVQMASIMPSYVTVLLVTIACVLFPLTATSQPYVQIEDVKQLAGQWEGSIGNILTGITINDDGSYEGAGWEGRRVVGRITVKDGKAFYKSNLTEGQVFLYLDGTKSVLRFVTSRGAVNDVQRSK
jgi:hypothetical protein